MAWNRITPGMKLRVLCWWLAAVAFAGCGLVRWTQFFVAKPPAFQNPDAALDALALQHFGLEHGAATLRHELAAFPPDAPLLVFGPGKDWTLTEAHFLISYLAWPRPVWCVGIVPPGERAAFDHPPPPGFKATGLFFYKIGPLPGLPARRLSERLALGSAPP
jgi:hypothetical protein